jgi:hypothetical protein
MEKPFAMAAKTCPSERNRYRKVMYTFLDPYYGLCLDKKEILMAQLDACERLSKIRVDSTDVKVIDMEIA